MANLIPIRERKAAEDGYMLLAAMLLLFLLVISLSVAVPQIAKSIQRDREVETMQRGRQYRRAIQLYYRKFGAYPPSIDALVKTSNIRFLRKKYADPMTGKDDWKPILFGQNKAPLAMGFFGEPLGGLSGATPIAGTGPSGGNTTPGAGLGTQSGGTFGSGPSSSTGGLFGPSGSSTGTGNSTTTGGTDSNGNPTGTPGQTGSTGTTTGIGATPGAGTGAGTGTGTAGLSGQTGRTFGGAGIVGVEPLSPKPSILLLKKKDHYNEWEFTYSPLSEMKLQPGGNTGANGLNGQSGAPGFGPNRGPTSGPGFGASPSPSPTQPQQ